MQDSHKISSWFCNLQNFTLSQKKIKMIWEEEIKQAIQMGSPHFLQPWENTQQTDKFKDISLSLLSSNADKFRNKKYFFLFTTGNKWSHFLEHYRLCKAAEQLSQPDTKFLRLVLMKTIPIWKLNSLTMHIFIFPFFFSEMQIESHVFIFEGCWLYSPITNECALRLQSNLSNNGVWKKLENIYIYK